MRRGGRGLQSHRRRLGEVGAHDGGSTAFDLHLIVRPGPITLDLNGLLIPNEDLGTSVTMPVGSVGNLHLVGNWSAPAPNAVANRLFAENHRANRYAIGFDVP